jgi:hypothetical protein
MAAFTGAIRPQTKQALARERLVHPLDEIAEHAPVSRSNTG